MISLDGNVIPPPLSVRIRRFKIRMIRKLLLKYTEQL
jgi:hypothetical protein